MKRKLLIAFAVLIVIAGITSSFAPSNTNRTSITAKLNQTVTLNDVTLTPREIIEDSRCPIDVTCIQAGTVRVSVDIESGLGDSTMTLKLQESITTEAEEVTLIDVAPLPEQFKTIDVSDYIFTFQVLKRTTEF